MLSIDEGFDKALKKIKKFYKYSALLTSLVKDLKKESETLYIYGDDSNYEMDVEEVKIGCLWVSHRTNYVAHIRKITDEMRSLMPEGESPDYVITVNMLNFIKLAPAQRSFVLRHELHHLWLQSEDDVVHHGLRKHQLTDFPEDMRLYGIQHPYACYYKEFKPEISKRIEEELQTYGESLEILVKEVLELIDSRLLPRVKENDDSKHIDTLEKFVDALSSPFTSGDKIEL